MITGFCLDIYDCDISFAWDTNEKELRAFLEANDVPEEKRDEFIANVLKVYAGAVTVGMAESSNCITVFNCKPNNKVVAHEIFHIAHRVLTLREIDDEEAWAYLIGYLTEMFYDLYLGKIETEDISPKGGIEMSSIDIPINDNIPERKYIICCRKFDGVSTAACPCVGQIATNSKLIAYFLYRRWSRWAYKNRNDGYTIAVMLVKRNNKGLYDTIKR